jgi:hypothetical protein
MWNIPLPRLSVAGLLAFAALAGGSRAGAAQDRDAAHEKQTSARQEPSTLGISIPWQWLASTGGTMNFQCEANRPADDDGVRMVEALSRAGRKGRYAGKGGDGGTFTGARDGDDFTFEAISKDGSRFAMQMPWLAARCIFGGAKLAGASSVDLHAREIGGRLRLEVAGQKKGVSVDVK